MPGLKWNGHIGKVELMLDMALKLIDLFGWKQGGAGGGARGRGRPFLFRLSLGGVVG